MIHGLVRGRYTFYIPCGAPRRAGVKCSVLAQVVDCPDCLKALAARFSEWGAHA